MRKRQWVDVGTQVIVLREFQNDKCEIIQKFEQEQVDVLLKNNIISEAFVKDGSTFNKDEEKEEYHILKINKKIILLMILISMIFKIIFINKFDFYFYLKYKI